MLTRLLFLCLVHVLTFHSASLALAAPAPEERTLRGRITLWSRSSCGPDTGCEIPKPLDIEWPVELRLASGPFKRGTQTVLARQTFRQKNWSVELSLYRVDPANGGTPYVITQTRLIEAVLGVLAECSRYDGIETIGFLQPGSCSAGGRGFKTYGVSLMRTP
jgi:hypothetical protein